jgi:hypothetical protein
VELPRYWIPIDGDAARRLEAELGRELAPLHPLHGRSLRAIARRPDRDDVLFEELSDATVHWVHLTWHVEKDPQWPRAESYRSLEEFRDRWPREELEEFEHEEDENAG